MYYIQNNDKFINQDEYFSEIEFSLKNSGNTPGVNVILMGELIDDVDDIKGFTAGVCEDFKIRLGSSKFSEKSKTVYPTQTATVTQERIEDTAEANTAIIGEGRAFFAGCIFYESPLDQKFHQISFIYTLKIKKEVEKYKSIDLTKKRIKFEDFIIKPDEIEMLESSIVGSGD